MIQFVSFASSVTLLIIGHILFWYAVIRLFHIVSLSGQVISALIIFSLFFGAILSSYLSHRRHNLFTRFYYLFSALWIGLFINMSLMIGLIILVRLAEVRLGFSVSLIGLKFIFVGGGLALSIWGIGRAYFPKIVTYDIKIKDLPSAWDNKVIVQLSDLHLGPIYQKKFFYRLIDKVNTLKPSAVFITGDLFDGTEADFSWLNHPFAKLNAPQGIYYGFGNHDLYLGFQRVIDLLSDNPVTILDNSLVNIDGLQIIGVNYSFDSSFDLEKEILQKVNYRKDQPSILLLHAPRNIQAAKKAGIDLQLSGHTHDGQLWPFNYIVKIAHHGYSYGLFREDGFFLVVNAGAGTWGPPMRTAARSEIVKIILHRA